MGVGLPWEVIFLMAFMDDMPDVVSVCRSRSYIVLYGIADKKTQNIKDLVSKQRDKKVPVWIYSAPAMNMLTTTTTFGSRSFPLYLPQAVTDYEFPQEELGFSTVGELLQRVPGVEIKRPPNGPSLMVYCTKEKSPSKEEEEEEEEEEESGLQEKRAETENVRKL